ncbi:BlaI/MecI/CopY family transcriptional regulator [Hymenobacter sp. BT186]|jgi:predicted transcriptional regulator|uniref:BlaI/MecI/CopY family transcriptional regulator n=1 Tax=Hymenobacter telluris TaxID=2816474 RepID=A0A939EUZ4_9BACT|nr:BlaI/MecI/CopY family transcriptional regulator [Hymenobacter telluris]MBO0358319.1 BlaI/MecI/CopY family transcriptional regulator [Hymenobacter telluris]MBW3374345.1 BlaI/MecI/CopY family transcriptional regulator [Hymenobacter norwichensis]
MQTFPELTRAEEQVMQVLWQRGPSFVKDVLADMPAPPPAYNTVSTIIRILEQKGFVGHEAFGRTHRYHALVAQDDYRRFSLRKLLGGHFGGSFSRLLSFFAKEEDLDAKQLEELLRHAQQDLSPDDDAPANDSRPA